MDAPAPAGPSGQSPFQPFLAARAGVLPPPPSSLPGPCLAPYMTPAAPPAYLPPTFSANLPGGTFPTVGWGQPGGPGGVSGLAGHPDRIGPMIHELEGQAQVQADVALSALNSALRQALRQSPDRAEFELARAYDAMNEYADLTWGKGDTRYHDVRDGLYSYYYQVEEQVRAARAREGTPQEDMAREAALGHERHVVTYRNYSDQAPTTAELLAEAGSKTVEDIGSGASTVWRVTRGAGEAVVSAGRAATKVWNVTADATGSDGRAAGLWLGLAGAGLAYYLLRRKG